MTTLDTLFSLEGRRALITGGSSGLGFEIATALALAGASVLLVARHEPHLKAASEHIRQAGGAADYLAADLATSEGIAAVRAGSGSASDIDILVNAAGMNLRKPAQELTRSEWNETLNLNLSVPFFLAREFAETMMERGWGRIINISSLQAVRAFPNSMPYGAAKGGIGQLTRAMAEAWSGRGVCCNAIAPGLFPTELTAPLYADTEAVARMAAMTCAGRNGALRDLWGLSIFLASPAAAYITGQTIFLDGGLTAK